MTATCDIPGSVNASLTAALDLHRDEAASLGVAAQTEGTDAAYGALRRKCARSGRGTWCCDLLRGTWTWDELSAAILGVEERSGSAVSLAVGLAVGALWPRLVHPDDRAGVDAAWAAAQHKDGCGTFDRRFRILRDDGTTARVWARGEVIFRGEGMHRRAVALVGSLECVELPVATSQASGARNESTIEDEAMLNQLETNGAVSTEQDPTRRRSGAHGRDGQPSTAACDLRLLIVDDNEDLAISLSIILQRLGYQTHVVHDGLDAIEAVERFCPDILLLDIGLPGLNGYEVARQLRRDDRFATLPIIAISGYGQQRDKERSAEVGINHHLVKPVEHQSLLGLIRAAASGESSTH